MDRSIFGWINRLADRTGWAHGLFKANAGYGIALFAVLLLAAYIDGRQHADLTAVAASVWAAGAALTALGIAQVIGGAVDRARPYETMTNVHLLVDKTTDFSFPATTPPSPVPWPSDSCSPIADGASSPACSLR